MIGSGDSHLNIPVLMLVVVGGFIVLAWGWRGAPIAVRFYAAFAILALVIEWTVMESFDRPRVARKLIAVHRRGALPFCRIP